MDNCSAGAPILVIDDLTVDYRSRGKTRRVVLGLSLKVERGEMVGLVGESGCGKSTLAATVMRLLPSAGKVVSGQVILDGVGNVLELAAEPLRRMRGSTVAMVFQDPLTSLNPTFRVGQQMVDVQAAHASSHVSHRDRIEYRRRAVALLGQVGLADPHRVIDAYPHELSGGMRQRVVIATALSLDPDLLIADEATSALDVTTQAQILQLLRNLQQARGMAVVLVTHDLGVVAQSCDRVAVMYAGQIVERGNTVSVFADPRHPYTRALLETIPRQEQRGRSLVTIPGHVPLFDSSYIGCRFASRCRFCKEVCQTVTPPVVDDGNVSVRCHMEDPSSPWHTAGASLS